MMPRRRVIRMIRDQGSGRFAFYKLSCGHEVYREIKLRKRWALCGKCPPVDSTRECATSNTSANQGE